MDKVRILEVKKTILEDNDADADLLRQELKDKKTVYLNLMSSPGSGKTTLLLRTIEKLKSSLSIGVMEADIDSDVDARTITRNTGIPSVQLHTGGMCHLDAQMSRQGIQALEEEVLGNHRTTVKKYRTDDADNEMDAGLDLVKNAGLDLVILENVGNLVCPAEFDTGAHINAVILSVTEGHDKPLKYPLMFELCDVVIINKTDALSVFDFDIKKAEEYIYKRNPHAVIFPVSAKTGEGINAWTDWLSKKLDASFKAVCKGVSYGSKSN